MSGVTITLSGSVSTTTTTDSNGNYLFANLPFGSYGLTPSKPNYTFDPPGFSLPNIAIDANVNFVATLRQSGPNSVGFEVAGYQYSESDPRATLVVIRTGDTSGAATLDYRTVDSDTFNIGCADTVNNNGGAFARCDFDTHGGVSHSPGEFPRPYRDDIDDGHDENGSLPTATFDATGSARRSAAKRRHRHATGHGRGRRTQPDHPLSPADTSSSPSQYLDFLSRSRSRPALDAGDERCPNVTRGQPRNGLRPLAVARAFFEAPEFNIKGFYRSVSTRGLNRYPIEIVTAECLAGRRRRKSSRRAHGAASSATRIYERLRRHVERAVGLGLADLLTPTITSTTSSPRQRTRVRCRATELTSASTNPLTRAQSSATSPTRIRCTR